MLTADLPLITIFGLDAEGLLTSIIQRLYSVEKKKLQFTYKIDFQLLNLESNNFV